MRSDAQKASTKRYVETGQHMLATSRDQHLQRERERYLREWDRRMAEAEEHAPVLRRRG